MNGPFVVAQAGSSATGASNSSASPIQIIKVVKPPAGETVIYQASFTGNVKVDFTAIANEQITFFHDNTDQSLHVIFADGSQAIIFPFFDSMGVLSNLGIEVGPNQVLDGTQFVAQFPISTDQAVLPAAGPGATNPNLAAGADFQNPSVDPLGLLEPLPLLPPEELPPIQFTQTLPGLLPTETTPPPNLIPTFGESVVGVVEEEELTPYLQDSDAGFGNEDEASLSGDDQDTSSDHTITRLDTSGTLAGLIVGGDQPPHFSIVDVGGAPVLDTDGNPVTSIGEAVEYKFISSTQIEGWAYPDQAPPRLIFTLVVNDDGTFTFTLNDQVDHLSLNGLAGDDLENLLILNLTSTIAVVDNTGDPIVLPDHAFTMKVIDDIPIALDEPRGVHATEYRRSPSW